MEGCQVEFPETSRPHWDPVHYLRRIWEIHTDAGVEDEANTQFSMFSKFITFFDGCRYRIHPESTVYRMNSNVWLSSGSLTQARTNLHNLQPNTTARPRVQVIAQVEQKANYSSHDEVCVFKSYSPIAQTDTVFTLVIAPVNGTSERRSHTEKLRVRHKTVHEETPGLRGWMQGANTMTRVQRQAAAAGQR